ncbi:MAG TPA: choice-of-anchor D domain-containing protein [Thermoanaerobaculaceae bacterium]|nr:choice-of-anchor D domain-containing protein [Thermoanaerobaculaceae bacterium]
MDRRCVATLVAVLLAITVAIPVAARDTALRPTFMTPFDPQGGFEVQALVSGFWQHVGELPCDRYVRERGLTLPAAALAAPEVRVRLVQHGGGAAQIDRVLLGEVPATRIRGAGETDAVTLAARRDNDVLDAFGKTIELTFPGRTREAVLRLAARVEPKVNEGSPFAFPPANQFDPAAPTAFYHYRPGATGHAPSWPNGLDPANALFAERCRPTTGHPDGVTYGWVANDRDTLFAEVEFTSDNTRDGDKDWSSVTVLRNGELKEFRVSEDQTRWGRPSFLRTDRAGYRHKLYAFAIPFAQLGVRSAKDAGDLKLAFAAYGTAAMTWLSPIYHDFGDIQVGSTSSPLTVTIMNIFSSDIMLDTPYFTRSGPYSSQFPLTAGTCADGLIVHPSGSCTFQVAFAPTAAGEIGDQIVVAILNSSEVRLTQALNLNGTGILPIPTVTPVGIALLALALSGLGYFILRRR